VYFLVFFKNPEHLGGSGYLAMPLAFLFVAGHILIGIALCSYPVQLLASALV